MKLQTYGILTRLLICGTIVLNTGCSNEVRGGDNVRLTPEEVEANKQLYAQHQAALRVGWQALKGAFVRSDGRVIDTHTGVSHSEGQSYAMLVATYVNDQPTFDSVWKWSKDNLRVRGDNLFAWRYVNEGGGSVPDKNNASDGCIAIAWALIRASELWDNPTYLDEAKLILEDVRAKNVVSDSGRFLLLPGTEGFQENGETTVNLSYYLYPAFEVFAEVDSEPEFWRMLIDEGLRLTEDSLLGDQNLPADWITVGDAIRPGDRWDPVFSYDAIRLPLYLFWGGELKRTPLFHISLQMTWRRLDPSRFPARVPLHGELTPANGETVLFGMRKVYEIASEPTAVTLYETPDPNGIVKIQEGYYSSALALLVACARLDALERGY